MNKLRVGFIGLGLMGKPMAKNILKKKFPLIVWSRTKSKTEELEKLGATVAKTPKELAQEVDIVITMVTAGKDVEKILFGTNGVIESKNKNLVIIDMSTIGPTFAKQIAKKLAKKQITFFDSPVTGSTPAAINGTLTIFVGGDKKMFTKIKAVLLAMGKNIHYMGEVGSGQGIKLINNHLVASETVALAESFLLADAMRLDRKMLGKVLKTIPVMSSYLSMKLPNYIEDMFPLFFSAANMKKDELLALSEATKGKKKLPLLTNIVKLYKQLSKKGLDQEDMSIVIKALEK